MIESSISLLPAVRQHQKPLVALIFSQQEQSAQELLGLLKTLDIQTESQVIRVIRSVHASTYLGKGLLEDIQTQAEQLSVDLVALDEDLSAHQLQKCQAVIGLPVLDRSGIIIEIFSRNARSKEAKTQVAMARLNYLLPRLSHLWSHFERQQGGGALTRGMGEKQLEVDRRLVKNRLTQLKKQLIEIQKERKNRRKGRQDVLKVALVGYTNVGKSTLLNQLTDSDVVVENKLFATLDSSARMMDPVSQPQVIVLDTVGFIRKLPVSLIASFRSTIEEIFDADLLVHVLDASQPHVQEQKEVTDQILKDLHLDEKPTILVLNKADLLTSVTQKSLLKIQFGNAIMVSSQKKADIVFLRKHLLDFLEKDLVTIEVVIPYDSGDLEAKTYRFAHVEKKKYLEKGIFLKLRMQSQWIKKCGLSKYQL
jgi:GTP-binding protein HflX